MPESKGPNLTASLPERFDNYSDLVEGIVLRGIEHPACELKRAVTIAKSDLADRLEFVKFFQGLANSHTKSECLIVIGADQKECKFFDMANSDEFDPAKFSPIIAKYLSQEPKYEINNMKASSGERYVLIVLNAIQPRPILMQKDGDSAEKIHFKPGDIWIKHNTGLRPASKADLDLM
jgi:hypothetical protein